MLLQGRSVKFVEFMKLHKKLKIQVYAAREGTIFGSNEPIITVVGYLPHIRLVEGMMNVLNVGSLLYTSWRRNVLTAYPQPLSAFDRRRAQNAAESGIASLAAGVFGSSNQELLRYFDFTLIATMGHEWIMSFPTIEEAFDAWLTTMPQKAVGLVDTHKCIEHDFPAWLNAVYLHRHEIKTANPMIWGWRNDSGDLAYLPMKQWQMFLAHDLAQDPWFVEHVRIFQTNDLDEYLIKDIRDQIREQAVEFGIEAEDVVNRLSWAEGTKPGTASAQPSLGGVAKLMQVENTACIKLAFNAQGEPGVKTSIPGFNLSAKILDNRGKLVCIYIYPASMYHINDDGSLENLVTDKTVTNLIAHHPSNPGAQMIVHDYQAIAQQTLIYDSLRGSGFTESWPLNTSLDDVPLHAANEEALLDASQLRLKNPHVVKISLSPELFNLRAQLIADGKLSAEAITSLIF
jgi:nicotinate phosphoribosyltransferase